ncbi:TetR/AcrR family transcriptional regulator [Nocardioides sp. NPDC051685]|uniref:TetR/AcrR family transcriptional regulator n=1 Tax=Nocardioides sp. NPDC051685 TaxID=3364334 RepID=UPI0037A7C758
MKSKRAYTMTRRAEAAEQTRLRIQDAVIAYAEERLLRDVSLDDVARRADVSVQTVLRHFGSKAGLVTAATDYMSRQVQVERAAPTGDLDSAVHTLLDHYERRGRLSLLLLAQEDTDEQVRSITSIGKRMHREWVRAVLVPEGADDELVDLLVVATDVYTWKLLRRDRQLSRPQTEQRIKKLVAAVLATAGSEIR